MMWLNLGECMDKFLCFIEYSLTIKQPCQFCTSVLLSSVS